MVVSQVILLMWVNKWQNSCKFDQPKKTSCKILSGCSGPDYFAILHCYPAFEQEFYPPVYCKTPHSLHVSSTKGKWILDIPNNIAAGETVKNELGLNL